MAGCPRTPRGGRYSSDPLHRPRHLGADNLDALWVVVGPGDPGLAMLGREPPGLLDPADRGGPFRELLGGIGQLELIGRPCDRCAPMTFRQVIDSLEAAMGRAARRLRNPDALCRLTWTPGVCRRSPPAGDWWHIRQLVRAASSPRFTAVLPRGSSGDTKEPAAPAGGWGHSERIGVRGPETSGWPPGTGGSGLAAGVPLGARSPTACDPSASLAGPAPSQEWSNPVDRRLTDHAAPLVWLVGLITSLLGCASAGMVAWADATRAAV